MGNQDEQLSLFGSEEGIIDDNEDKKRDEGPTQISFIHISLKKRYCDEVDRYLLAGVQSAVEIAERLISEQGANPDRYMSGKPKIFAEVCQYLDSLSNVKLLEAKEDKTDRIYSVET